VRAEPYLFFHGRCEEALEFYRAAAGAQVQMMVRFGDMPSPPPNAENRIMHAAFRVGETTILASDGDGSGGGRFEGFSMALTVADDAEAARLFGALADGGEVRMPLMPTPFASQMGMLTDRFGVPWMVVAQPPQA
jgi:PhnB protein